MVIKSTTSLTKKATLIFIYMYIYTQTHTHTHTYIYIYMYIIYIYIYIYIIYIYISLKKLLKNIIENKDCFFELCKYVNIKIQNEIIENKHTWMNEWMKCINIYLSNRNYLQILLTNSDTGH